MFFTLELFDTVEGCNNKWSFLCFCIFILIPQLFLRADCAQSGFVLFHLNPSKVKHWWQRHIGDISAMLLSSSTNCSSNRNSRNKQTELTQTDHTWSWIWQTDHTWSWFWQTDHTWSWFWVGPLVLSAGTCPVSDHELQLLLSFRILS